MLQQPPSHRSSSCEHGHTTLRRSLPTGSHRLKPAEIDHSPQCQSGSGVGGGCGVYCLNTIITQALGQCTFNPHCQRHGRQSSWVSAGNGAFLLRLIRIQTPKEADHQSSVWKDTYIPGASCPIGLCDGRSSVCIPPAATTGRHCGTPLNGPPASQQCLERRSV